MSTDVLYERYSCRGVKLTIHVDVVPRIGVNGAVLLLPYLLFIAWGKSLPLLSHITVFLFTNFLNPEKPVKSFKRDRDVDVGATSFTNFT